MTDPENTPPIEPKTPPPGFGHNSGRTRGLREPWPAGVSGNPKGRPRAAPEGAGKRGTMAFAKAVEAEFHLAGPAVIRRLRKHNPAAFLQLVALVAIDEHAQLR